MNASVGELWKTIVTTRETTTTKRGYKIIISILLEEVNEHQLQIL